MSLYFRSKYKWQYPVSKQFFILSLYVQFLKKDVRLFSSLLLVSILSMVRPSLTNIEMSSNEENTHYI